MGADQSPSLQPPSPESETWAQYRAREGLLNQVFSTYLTPEAIADIRNRQEPFELRIGTLNLYRKEDDPTKPKPAFHPDDSHYHLGMHLTTPEKIIDIDAAYSHDRQLLYADASNHSATYEPNQPVNPGITEINNLGNFLRSEGVIGTPSGPTPPSNQ